MTKEKGFDFATLDIRAKSEKPFEFEIVHFDTGEGLGVFVSAIGSESETFRRFLRAEGDLARRKAFDAERKGEEPGPVLVEEEENLGVRALAACIKEWRTLIDGASEPVIVIDGQRLDCTHENACAWLTRFPWVRPQVNKATGEIGNFLSDSSQALARSPKPSSS